MICFYHNDLDGHCSGALVKLFYKGCEMIEMDYGKEFPWEKIEDHDEVWMVDFSLNRGDMIRLNMEKQFIWIDHHKTAIEKMEHLLGWFDIDGIRRIGLGACALVWEYLKKNDNKHLSYQVKARSELPTFIKLIAEYDVWIHTDPRTLLFQSGMQLFDTKPDNVEFWNDLFDVEQVIHICNLGETILKYKELSNKNLSAKFAFDIEFEGFRFIAANSYSSAKYFDSVYDPDKHDAMLTFVFEKDKWKVTMYSNKPDIDVSDVAKKYGGGGHAGACGFYIDDIKKVIK